MWIFGYSSLIRDLSSDDASTRLIPLRMNHWTRTWSAFRRDGYPFPKRYVEDETFKVVPSFAFSNIVPSEGGLLNGVAFCIADPMIAAYDFREYGYARINVKEWCTYYDGTPFEKDIFAYADSSQPPQDEPESISCRYLNMGIEGARAVDRLQPTFLSDYILTTRLPKGGVAQWTFIFIGLDGKTVWILDEHTGNQTCILILPVSFKGAHAPKLNPEESFEWQIPCAAPLSRYDVRNNQEDFNGNSFERHPVLDKVSSALISDDPSEYMLSENWLVRFACLCRHDSMDLAAKLLKDSDSWVRNIAATMIDESNNA